MRPRIVAFIIRTQLFIAFGVFLKNLSLIVLRTSFFSHTTTERRVDKQRNSAHLKNQVLNLQQK